MPADLQEYREIKARNLVKSYIDNNCNQSAVARKVGTTSQAINQRLQTPLVKKTLADYLNKKFNKKYIQKKFQDGLEAKKVVGFLNNKVDGAQKVSDEFVEVDDLHCRHKYLRTLLECGGHLNNSIVIDQSQNTYFSKINIENKTPDELLEIILKRKNELPGPGK